MSAWHVELEDFAQLLSSVRVGGERIPKDVVRKWFAKFRKLKRCVVCGTRRPVAMVLGRLHDQRLALEEGKSWLLVFPVCDRCDDERLASWVEAQAGAAA